MPLTLEQESLDWNCRIVKVEAKITVHVHYRWYNHLIVSAGWRGQIGDFKDCNEIKNSYLPNCKYAILKYVACCLFLENVLKVTFHFCTGFSVIFHSYFSQHGIFTIVRFFASLYINVCKLAQDMGVTCGGTYRALKKHLHLHLLMNWDKGTSSMLNSENEFSVAWYDKNHTRCFSERIWVWWSLVRQ